MKKEIYLTYSNREGLPEITVCYLYNGTRIARGISIRNRKEDKIDEKEGKFQARCNADRALKGRRIDSITNVSAIRSLIECECPFSIKGEILTRFTLPFYVAKIILGNRKYMKFYEKPVKIPTLKFAYKNIIDDLSPNKCCQEC